MEETSFGLHLLYSSWRDQVLISSPDPRGRTAGKESKGEWLRLQDKRHWAMYGNWGEIWSSCGILPAETLPVLRGAGRDFPWGCPCVSPGAT